MVSAEIRHRYAEEIGKNAKVRSTALLQAFAKVSREEFVGKGPWKVLSRPAVGYSQPQVTEVTDPAELYRDVAILLDPLRNLTNGNPGTLAPWLDALDLSEGKSAFHLGCGTGYYTAIMAEAVGPAGQVTAFEIDPTLAAQARTNLARYPNVQVVQGDGGVADTGARDAILINAGVTHPRESWLDNLRPSGCLVLPLTVEIGMPHVGKGMMLHVSRTGSGYAARFLPDSGNDLFMQQRSGLPVRQPLGPTVHVRHFQLGAIAAAGRAFSRTGLLAAHVQFLPLDAPDHLI